MTIIHEAVSNIGLMRTYEDNLMVGSSTWLQAAPELVGRLVKKDNPAALKPHCSAGAEQTSFGCCDWIVFSRGYAFETYYHAVRSDFTKSQVNFHMWDKCPATSLEEVMDAIKYWDETNEYDHEGGKFSTDMFAELVKEYCTEAEVQ